jgi:outer membrane protein
MNLQHLVTACSALLIAMATHATEPTFTGDVGLGVNHLQAQVRGAQARNDALPYLNVEFGPAFARIDTLGVKLLPLGWGHVEVLGQVRSDGYHSDTLQTRQNSLPLGLGTLQITPVGAFNLQWLHDFGQSGGNLVQARYLAELVWGRVSLYPELGVEAQSRAYTGYYLGTTASDAAALGQSYRPAAALNPYLGAMIETRLTQHWFANAYVRRSHSDHSLAQSPLVTRSTQDSVLLALAYRY